MTTVPRPPRVTQQRIAELAGVSQATVSLVLNGKADAASRIPEATRRRVLDVIHETTYVADPAARRLAGVGNNILGVFTYEHAFPHETSDFYAPLLTGVEFAAEELGCDLLMFTSAPVTDGHRRIFHENNRLGLADGCLLLGREMDADELTRLVDSGYPFVAIGRRDAAGGRVPYVGVDYVSATATLARMALQAGHREVFYVSLDRAGESSRDRLAGLRGELDAAGIPLTTASSTNEDLPEVWERVRRSSATAVFVEDPTQAALLAGLAAADGVSIPADLSFVVLGEHSRPDGHGIDFTRLSPPRTELGEQAVRLLDQFLNGPRDARELLPQTLLACAIDPGTTLGSPRRAS